jgi:hypothetical protein
LNNAIRISSRNALSRYVYDYARLRLTVPNDTYCERALLRVAAIDSSLCDTVHLDEGISTPEIENDVRQLP